MVTKKSTNKIKKQLRKAEPKVRGIIAVIDVSVRIAVAIALVVLSDNNLLRYTAYYIGATAVIELAWSVFGKNAQPSDN
jgi:hypothetical protein